MKSRRRNRSSSRWAWNNSPAGLRNRRAKADARREERIAGLPPVTPGPAPLSHWQTVQVLGSHGQVLHTLALYVPTAGRCDQHAAEIDGARCDRMLTATEVGRTVAGWIAKRPSVALLADMRTA
jgi:hypothetical protein